MVQNLITIATGVLKGVGKNGHSVKGTLGIDAGGKGDDSGSEPRWVESHGAKVIANDVSKKANLRNRSCGVRCNLFKIGWAISVMSQQLDCPLRFHLYQQVRESLKATDME